MIFEKCESKEQVTWKLLNLFRDAVNKHLETKEIVQIAIATGNTFSDFLRQLGKTDIPFHQIDLFVVDEYAGVNIDDKRSCTIDLCRDLNNIENFHKTYFFDAKSYPEQIRFLNQKLQTNPLDVLLLGIGNDGHYAFCNRREENLHRDTYSIVNFTKEDIELQVESGWFPTTDIIPRKGITITKYGVLNSKTVILAGFRGEKESILNKIMLNNVPKEMPIFEIIQRDDVILVTD